MGGRWSQIHILTIRIIIFGICKFMIFDQMFNIKNLHMLKIILLMVKIWIRDHLPPHFIPLLISESGVRISIFPLQMVKKANLNLVKAQPKNGTVGGVNVIFSQKFRLVPTFSMPLREKMGGREWKSKLSLFQLTLVSMEQIILCNGRMNEFSDNVWSLVYIGLFNQI